MGKCVICGKKIQYNQFKKIDGIIYCPDCVCFAPKKEAVDKKLTEALGEPMNMTIVTDEAVNVDFSNLAEELAKVPKINKKRRKPRRKKSRK